MSAINPEPKPRANDNPAIWTLVLEDVPYVFPRADQAIVVAELRNDMHARDEMGRAKYGTHLQAHNGRRPLVDAYQEALDLCAYLKQETEEATALGDKDWAYAMYRNALRMAYSIKRRLMIREGWKP